jgi:hypothetical protein
MTFRRPGVPCDDLAAEMPCFDPIRMVEEAFMTGPAPAAPEPSVAFVMLPRMIPIELIQMEATP